MAQLTYNDLHAYQLRGVEALTTNTHYGLFLDMGLGKTATTLTAINSLLNEELAIDSVLMIAPKRVASQVWANEVQKWAHLKGLRVVCVQGTPKQRLAALKQKADIYTLGRDNVAWLCGLYGGGKLPFDMLVIDESSSFKNHASVRFKALKRVMHSFKRVVILTGTPAPKGYIDLWAQIGLLDRGERLGKTITAYRDRYFSRNYSGWGYNPREGAEDEINEKIKDIVVSMSAADYLSLPEFKYNYIELEMSPELKRTYNNFEREQVLEMFLEQDIEITAMNAAALRNKLLQFASGAVYDEDRNVHLIHDLKLEAAEEVVEAANGKPVLIAYTYQHERDRLLKHLKAYNPVQLSTDKHIKDWNAGKIQVMIMHPASGGHGLNLQDGGSIALWYTLNDSLELYEQFNKRLDRQGQKDSGFIHHLIVKGTADEDVLKNLTEKGDTQAALLKAVKELIAKHKKYLK